MDSNANTAAGPGAPAQHHHQQHQHPHDDDPSSPHGDDQRPASKRSRISVACNTCRKKKIRCDGSLPCEYCSRANFPCTYQMPKRRGPTMRAGSGSGADTGSGAGDAHPSGGNAADGMDVTGPDAGADGRARGSGDDDEDLADMMTFLVSLEENGGINALRSLGSSSGMHLLRMWSDRVSEGVLVVPSVLKKHTPRGAECDLPPREIIDLLLDFFFEYLHPFMPVVEKQMIYNSLSQPNPPLMLLNSIFAVSSRVYEGLSQDKSDKPGASDIFLNRARQIARNILLEPPCLEYIQALLLLSFHELGFLRGSTWLVSGVAIRMAQDIGLNRRMDNLTGALSITPMQRHLTKKTFTAIYVMDRFVSAVLGRPLAIHDEDCDVSWPSVEDERELSGPDGAHLIGDYNELAKLCVILGKVLRNINSVRNHTPGRLAFSLPEIHTALSQWLNQLPPTLRYSFSPRTPTPSRFSAFLNCAYYTTIILLYRPFISSAKARTSPLFPQYLHICSTAAQAIVHICHARVDEFFLLPNVVLYCLFTAITTLVITYNCMVPPTAPGAEPAPPPTAAEAAAGGPNGTAHTRANSLTALMKCLVILSTLQDVWPMANRIGFMLEDFFAAHRVAIPATARRCPPMPMRPPMPSAQCKDPAVVVEAYSRLMTAAADQANSGRMGSASASPASRSSAAGAGAGAGETASPSPSPSTFSARRNSPPNPNEADDATPSGSSPTCPLTFHDGIRIDRSRLAEVAKASGEPTVPTGEWSSEMRARRNNNEADAAQQQQQQQQQAQQQPTFQQGFFPSHPARGAGAAAKPVDNIYVNAGAFIPPAAASLGGFGTGFDFAGFGSGGTGEFGFNPTNPGAPAPGLGGYAAPGGSAYGNVAAGASLFGSAGVFGGPGGSVPGQGFGTAPRDADPLFSGGDPVAVAASAMPPQFMMGGYGGGGSSSYGFGAAAAAAATPAPAPPAGGNDAPFAALELEEMMGVQPSMEFGGLGLDASSLDAFMFNASN
ncbi:hypothetical protein H9P43_003020 [Blastocladiella emersonii ATCC 22665]|nr:hypothetical protein H9P43_003020 [Blastocladiella emersonii ATCC 22665]